MALGRLLRHKIIILTITVVALATAVFGMLYYLGTFLPGYITWEEKDMVDEKKGIAFICENKNIRAFNNDVQIFELDKRVKVQDYCLVDVDRDGLEELVILCWKIGKYGSRKPFWVKWDAPVWSQHIYIYEVEKNEIRPKWMASDIFQEVKSFEAYQGVLLKNTAPDGGVSYWMWDSWGLVRIDNPDDFFKKKTSDLEASETDNTIEKVEEASDFAGEDEKRVRIIMVGDVLLHDGINKACEIDGGYDYSPLFLNTKEDISAADIAIVNQEVIIGGKELKVTGYPSFNAPYEMGDALVDAGFDVICHATNHALDRGKKGIINCLNYWKEMHPEIAILGIYDNESDYNNIYICEVNGIKIAILNYTYGTNGIAIPKDMPYAVALLDKNKLEKDLAYAEENADFTVVCPHWGTEYRLSIDAYQEDMANAMVENGADLIIGTHPHVIEPIEWINTDSGNKALCYYSLGNFINWTSGRGENVANRMVGGLSDVTVCKEEGNAFISDFSVIPLVSHVENEKGKVTTYKLSDYTDELAKRNAITSQDACFDLDYCEELVNKVWGEID